MATSRVHFTPLDDNYLKQYLAKYAPTPSGRLGNKLYTTLVENAGGKWGFASRHSAQSWRDRYRRNQNEFDQRIRLHQQALAGRRSSPSTAEPQETGNGKKRKQATVLEDDGRGKKRTKVDGDQLASTTRAQGSSTANRNYLTQTTDSDTQDNEEPNHSKGKGHPPHQRHEEEESGSTNDDSNAPVTPLKGGEDEDEDEGEGEGIEEEDDRREQGKQEGEPELRGLAVNDVEMVDANTRPTVVQLAHVVDGPSEPQREVDRLATSAPRASEERPNVAAPAPTDSIVQKALPLESKAPIRSKPKPKRRRADSDDDPFMSTPENEKKTTTGRPTTPNSRRNPPVYKVGPHRQEIVPWPPRRGKLAAKPNLVPPVAAQPELPPRRETEAEQVEQPSCPMPNYKDKNPPTNPISPPVQLAPPKPPLRKESGHTVNAEPSSSKVMLPPSRYRTREEVLSSIQAPGIKPHPSVPAFESISTPNPQPAQVNTDNLQSPAPTIIPFAQNGVAIPQSISNSVRHRRQRRFPPVKSGGASGVITGLSTTLINDSGELDPAPVRLDDIFNDNGDKGPAQEQPIFYAAAPRVDLRKTLALQKFRKRTRSYASSTTSKASSTLSRLSTGLSLAERNVVPPNLFEEYGREMLAKLAAKYSCQFKMAVEAYGHLRDCAKVELFLKELEARMGDIAAGLVAEMKTADEGADPENTPVFDANSVQATRRSQSRRQSSLGGLHLDLAEVVRQQSREGGERRRSVARRRTLDIRPIPPGSFPEPPYSPPRSTRASRYTRTVNPIPGTEEMKALGENASKRSSLQQFVDLRGSPLLRSTPRRASNGKPMSSPLQRPEDSPPPQQPTRVSQQSKMKESPLRPAPSAVPSSDEESSESQEQGEGEEESEREDEDDDDNDEAGDVEHEETENPGEYEHEHDVEGESEGEYGEYEGEYEHEHGVKGEREGEYGESEADSEADAEDGDDAMIVEEELLSSPPRGNTQDLATQDLIERYEEMVDCLTEDTVGEMIELEQLISPEERKVLSLVRLKRLLEERWGEGSQ